MPVLDHNDCYVAAWNHVLDAHISEIWSAPKCVYKNILIKVNKHFIEHLKKNCETHGSIGIKQINTGT